MNDEKEVNCKFRNDQDTKRYHRFRIESENGVNGTVYIPKDRNGAPMPKKLILEYAN